jgi:WD40 repeat protein
MHQEEPVVGLVVGRQGLIICSQQGTVLQFDDTSGACHNKISTTHGASVNAVASDDKGFVYTASDDGSGDPPEFIFCLTSVSAGSAKAHLIEGVQAPVASAVNFQGHSGPVLSVAVHNERLYTGSTDNRILEWALPSPQLDQNMPIIQPLRCFAGHTAAVSAVCLDAGVSYGTSTLFSAGHDGTARRWDLAQGQCR